MKASCRVPGSCGELVQGRIEERDFLISCPINRFSQVSIVLSHKFSEIQIDASYPKTRLAVLKTLKLFDREELGARVEITSSLKNGKGMGNSTADITAAINATAIALGEELTLQEVMNIALSIEPTDSTFIPGMGLLDHRRGEWLQILPPPPPMQLLVLDTGGSVDTLDFNRNHKLDSLNRDKESECRKALQLIQAGLKKQNPRLIARGATISALAHQSILPKKALEELKERVVAAGATGICVAHSGTLIGIFLSPRQSVGQLEKLAASVLPGLKDCFLTRVIAGGMRPMAKGGLLNEKKGAWRQCIQYQQKIWSTS